MRIEEIQARLAEINEQIETATGEELTALEEESRNLLEELETEKRTIAARQELRSKIAAGAGEKMPGFEPKNKPSAEERAAQEFVQTRHMTLDAEQARATLISSGKLAQPTEVAGINDIPGAKYSSIIDLVKVVNCVGMGTYRVALTVADADEAADHTEGAAITDATLGEFDFVDIKPTSVAVIDYISKQAKKQTPLNYKAKVQDQAMIALRRKAAKIATAALTGSDKHTVVTGKAIGANTLRDIAMNYGGDESIIGGAVLFLNKTDLLAFGDVRGTNEKKALYTITPDAANPNTGVITEGGLSVRYCINKNVTVGELYYGNPQALELGLFSDYEIQVSTDFAINKLMDTIVGDVELGAGVTVKGGFVKYTTGA